jgi:hypothetical protein
MSVTILVCACGKRVRAPGARPGRAGRCPACGRSLKAPAATGAPARPETGAKVAAGTHMEDLATDTQDSTGAGGYLLEPAERPPICQARKQPRESSSPPARAPAGGEESASRIVDRTPMADGFLAPLTDSDRSVWASILYPLRGAEALAMVAIMGAIFWVFTILVPEYCLGIWDDANMLGASSMGMLVILISALPALLLFPLALIYTLQYLGRVLVSSARGETVPPRTPDRNFEGFFSGLYPWFIWLVFGAVVGLLPLMVSALFAGFAILNDPVRAAGLAMLGLPYALMALMMAFFHDHPLAATPIGVIGALIRHGGSFLPAMIKVMAVLGLAAMSFGLVLSMRTGHFWFYVPAALGCCAMAIWTGIVVMRIIGVHYFCHQDRLKWHGQTSRWGAAWRL